MTREEADMRALAELRDDLRLACDARVRGEHSRRVQLLAFQALEQADGMLTLHLRPCHGERPLVTLDDGLGWRVYCPVCWGEARAGTLDAVEGVWEKRMSSWAPTRAGLPYRTEEEYRWRTTRGPGR